MNKFKKIMLSIMGASDVIITILTPLFLIILWVNFFGVSWSTYLFIVICLLSGFFRAIKIGWLGLERKND